MGFAFLQIGAEGLAQSRITGVAFMGFGVVLPVCGDGFWGWFCIGHRGLLAYNRQSVQIGVADFWEIVK